MFDKFGPVGLLGLLLVLAGVALIAWQNLVIGAGVAFVLAGLGFVVYGIVSQLKASLGMGGAMP